MQNENEHPTVESQNNTPTVDGRAPVPTYPPGTAGLFGVEDPGGHGKYESSSREFMTAHTDDMQRLIAESILTSEQARDYCLLEAEEQSFWGQIHFPTIGRLSMGLTLSINGQGRKDAKDVETLGTKSAFDRIKRWPSRLFGFGGDSTPTPQSNQGSPPGY